MKRPNKLKYYHILNSGIQYNNIIERVIVIDHKGVTIAAFVKTEKLPDKWQNAENMIGELMERGASFYTKRDVGSLAKFIAKYFSIKTFIQYEREYIIKPINKTQFMMMRLDGV